MQNFNRVHFIGMGGIGINALARLSLSQRKTVSGSDALDSELLRDLKQQGARIFIGHKADHVAPATELVVYTEAIDASKNPELLRAEELGIPCMTYFEALGRISEQYKTIAIAGTHGKSTTTALLGRALVEDGFDPLVIVGTKVPDFQNRNVYIGKGEYFVVEACEYRRSFLNLQPQGLILLNCELDHTDYYRDEADYRSAFRALAEKVPQGGFIVANADDANLIWILGNPEGEDHDLRLQGLRAKIIWVCAKDLAETPITLQVPGSFNRLNALAALRAAETVGADPEIVMKSLESFKGTWRRMEIRGKFHGALVIDDYGHHPTEIRATLRALKEHYPKKRLLCVFQPHQYSRTYALLDAFKTAFEDADLVIVPNIYEARDTAQDKERISAKSFVRALQEKHPHAIFGNGFDRTLKLIAKKALENTLIVLMGAGDVTNLGGKLTPRPPL
ncbi:UDP-N-acetylmuramate--L-alanine ligase [Candidatus Peregrinibacteria bacterium]|nr:UDP-N-acetylmuramate--L-alanine ligase [Candidatus Peregrinibacteria bacterium]